MTAILWAYLLGINLITIIVMFSDKRKAIRNQWRIPEKVIFTLSFFGGAFGSLVGMYLFRHKTRHLSFRIILPIFFVWNLISVYFLLTGDLF